MLRAQTRLQWQIISTGMLTSFLFEPALGVVDLDNDIVRALGSWQTAVTVTTPEDIGRLTARIVCEPVQGNPILFCAGDTISYGQLTDTVERLLERPMRREQWTVPMRRNELMAARTTPCASTGRCSPKAWESPRTSPAPTTLSAAFRPRRSLNGWSSTCCDSVARVNDCRQHRLVRPYREARDSRTARSLPAHPPAPRPTHAWSRCPAEDLQAEPPHACRSR